jgi:hypothetical protein
MAHARPHSPPCPHPLIDRPVTTSTMPACASELIVERRPAEFSYLRGISADRLAPSMLKYTIECMMIAITSAQAISINTLELRAYIL